jgi:hypothetical protein
MSFIVTVIFKVARASGFHTVDLGLEIFLKDSLPPVAMGDGLQDPVASRLYEVPSVQSTVFAPTLSTRSLPQPAGHLWAAHSGDSK